MFLNVAVLVVGRDICLYFFEQMIHGIEFRTLFGQPNQLDVQPLCFGLTFRSGVCGACIQEQPDLPSSVAAAKHPQESLKASLVYFRMGHHDTMAGTYINGAEQNAFGIATGDADTSLLPLE